VTVPPAAVVAPRVDRLLAQVLDEERARWAEVDPDLADPLESLRSFVLAGGKRLRPAFCYWAFVGAGGDEGDPAVAAAGAALELLHAAALVHDDVIDGSAIRHGADTVHTRYANQHRRHGWSGDPTRFGDGVAIIVGDLAMAYSARLLAGAPAPAVAAFDEMRIAVNIGQFLDITGPLRRYDLADPATAERARRISRYKTATYTVEGPLRFGASWAAPSRAEELAAPLSAFAWPLGEAFQLRDDLLGVFGNEDTTGKPVGDDLREGKLTVLVSLTASRASGAGRKFLEDRLGAADLGDDDVDALQRLIVSAGAQAEVEASIARLYAQALTRLEQVPISQKSRSALSELAAFAVGRDH
jgi:geranylgeranyl diphosphate synthase, type I